MMKQINEQEEKNLIKLLKHSEFLGHGSSRIVFVHPNDETKVIKLSWGKQGQAQSETEVELYRKVEHPEYFTQIFEYGKYVTVAERLCEEVDEEWYPSTEEEEEREEEIMQQLSDLEDYLGDFNGYHGDNKQIGKRKDGSLCHYDFGFIEYDNENEDSEESFSSQVGSIREALEYLSIKEVVDIYIKYILKNFNEIIDTNDSKFLNLFKKRRKLCIKKLLSCYRAIQNLPCLFSKNVAKIVKWQR